MGSTKAVAKKALRAAQRLKFRVTDRLPAPIGDPLDDRLGRLVVGLQSVATHAAWRIAPMEGLDCSRSLWLGHAAFAYALTMWFRPKVVVDLGVLAGCSTMAIGLALKRLGRGVVYSVDTWEGDDHTGAYDDGVYQGFLADRQTLGLEDHVVPLRMRFDAAPSHVKGDVDLLHVDGFHTFKAASEDFALFRDRLSPGAPVLFHDVYSPSYPEMRLFWAAASRQYRSSLVKHSSGLGIILNRGGDRTLGLPESPEFLDLLRAVTARLNADGSLTPTAQ